MSAVTTMETTPGGVPQWTVGDRLRKSRSWRGVSIEEMAEEIGRSERTIRNYENDITTPSLAVIKQYVLRTGAPLQWILTGDTPAHEDDNGGPGQGVSHSACFDDRPVADVLPLRRAA